MASYDFWKLQSPPEQDESKHGCWDCSHMFELEDGRQICCFERDAHGTGGEVYVCNSILEYICMQIGTDWEGV